MSYPVGEQRRNLMALTVPHSGAQGPAMIPIMLQQGYKALAVTFDVWGVANMVKDGLDGARAISEKIAADAAAVQAENGTAKEANGSNN